MSKKGLNCHKHNILTATNVKKRDLWDVCATLSKLVNKKKVAT